MTKKRRLFDDLMEGIADMRNFREGKITLRTHKVEARSVLSVDASLIRETRERVCACHVSSLACSELQRVP
jgi:putative transcriptional regulator